MSRPRVAFFFSAHARDRTSFFSLPMLVVKENEDPGDQRYTAKKQGEARGSLCRSNALLAAGEADIVFEAKG